MLTFRDIVFSGVGVTVSFLIYLAKRKIEKLSQKENVELDQRRYELIEQFLANRPQWESTGVYVKPPASIEGLITHSMTPDMWEQNLLAVAALHLRAVYTGCLYVEAIASKYPEYAEALAAHRIEYARWYSHARDKLPILFEKLLPQETKTLHAYYHRIVDPTETNIDGFFATLSEYQRAIDSGEIKLLET